MRARVEKWMSWAGPSHLDHFVILEVISMLKYDFTVDKTPIVWLLIDRPSIDIYCIYWILGVVIGYSLSSPYSFHSYLTSGSFVFGGVIAVPHLFSIRARKVSILLISTGMWISATLIGLKVRLGKILPLYLITHWDISFSSPLADLSTQPRTYWLKRHFSLFSWKQHKSFHLYWHMFNMYLW